MPLPSQVFVDHLCEFMMVRGEVDNLLEVGEGVMREEVKL